MIRGETVGAKVASELPLPLQTAAAKLASSRQTATCCFNSPRQPLAMSMFDVDGIASLHFYCLVLNWDQPIASCLHDTLAS